jgi:hypothetical protein
MDREHFTSLQVLSFLEITRDFFQVAFFCKRVGREKP